MHNCSYNTCWLSAANKNPSSQLAGPVEQHKPYKKDMKHLSKREDDKYLNLVLISLMEKVGLLSKLIHSNQIKLSSSWQIDFLAGKTQDSTSGILR